MSFLLKNLEWKTMSFGCFLLFHFVSYFTDLCRTRYVYVCHPLVLTQLLRYKPSPPRAHRPREPGKEEDPVSVWRLEELRL